MTTSSQDSSPTQDAKVWPWEDTDPAPILFLDVDGVLNIFGGDGSDTKYMVGTADPGAGEAYGWVVSGRRYRIIWDPTIIERLQQINDSGLARVFWLTTWGRGANSELRELLGFTEFPVAYHPSYADQQSRGSRWWKLRTVQWFIESGPERKYVWCDDALAHEDVATEFAEQHNILWVGPPEHLGLTHEDLDRIEEFLAE